MPGFLTFFSPAVSRKFRRDPSGGFPARFGRAFRFGRRGHFVSDDLSVKICSMYCRARKSETKRNAKKSARRHWKVRRITPTCRPRREGPVISEHRERHPVAATMPLASRSIRSRRFFVVASGGLQALSEKPVSPQRCHRRNLRSPHTRGMPELLPDRKLYLMNKWKPLSGRWLSLTHPDLSNEISNRPKPAALRVRVAAMNRGGDNELKAGRLHLFSLRF